MSMVNIRDGIMANLLATGKWSQGELSTCDFGIMEFSASCIVLQPGPNTRFYPIAGLGRSTCGSTRTKRKEWSFAGIGLVKDAGNPLTLLGSLWTLCDDIVEALDADDTLNGTAMTSNITLLSRPSIDSFVNDGESDWGYITFALEAIEV